ncbi:MULTISPECIES: O-antigen ligase family protein [unclassified Leptolyngbya]|uniref:O-antigen ligase family protein n=1 Tax=unclassified Leptolyngbya TaxID=2650499 RepID=UPI001682D0C5|nr:MULTISPECIES: O-antigen ligase family protein [unclassified Leptolyngbya]MBD1910189.1 O-antigen ligase family protein [Leptolyngbya sp. FACHB-8]MBD2153822.1 O-antigen ligase family protein [Leptolyngbya sp. FACHB-16]
MTAVSPSPSLRKVLRASLVLLPYASYLGFLGILVVTLITCQAKRTALDSFTGRALLLIIGLMVLSSTVAYSRPEAFLQLGNFLPYFLFFAVAPLVFHRIEHWQQAATDLVLTILPLNLLSLVEYGLKSPALPLAWQTIPWIEALRLEPHRGRAVVTFDHPNAFASYLVIVFGLGLGLLLSQLGQQRERTLLTRQNLWLLAATFSCLIGIFASGSRNGLLVAISQIGVFLLLTRINLTLLLSGLIGLVAVAGGAVLFGVGGRSLSDNWAKDPRTGAWGVAIDLIRERPWLGWGPGNYKVLFPPRTFDPVNYPKMFHPHNIWLLLGSEMGLIVTALVTLFVGYICYRAARVWLSQQFPPVENGVLLAYGLGFWGCFAYGFLDVTLFDGRVHILNWLTLSGLWFFGQFWKSKVSPD